VQAIKQFAKDMNLEVWFSVSPVRPDVVIDEYGIPSTMQKYVRLIDVLIGLKYDDKKDKVIMTCVAQGRGGSIQANGCGPGSQDNAYLAVTETGGRSDAALSVSA
jgi:hypothetical protein